MSHHGAEYFGAPMFGIGVSGGTTLDMPPVTEASCASETSRSLAWLVMTR